MKYFGCAYYPEYWGRERFRIDAALMRDAGINIARIGEFAWTRMEPAEGAFTLDWLHECVATLGEFGIDVLMCTPSAAPPAWLINAYPDVLVQRMDGTRATHGGRRHYCMSSDTYRRHCARIAETLAQEIGRYGNVVAWQIDNELGPENSFCHCSNCQARFQTWLRERYGDIAGLNDAWKTGFWSMDYSQWSQVRLQDNADNYSSRNLDSRRFWSDLTVEFCAHQAGVLRAGDPGAMVTTNGMGPVFAPIDYYKLFADLDVACDDLYFDIATMDANACAMDIYRNIKPGRRFWITETGSGALDHNKPPHPDQFRAWMWSGFARGSEAHFIFRWRTCLSGQEQELQGIIEHSGEARHRYKAVQKAFKEAIALRPKLEGLPLPTADVAIIQDYQTLWSYESARIGKDVQYLNHVYRLHSWLYEHNVMADVVPPSSDLSRYKVVILPTLVTVEPEFTKKIEDFLEFGGVAVATGQLGMRDANDNYRIAPDPIQTLFGIKIEGGMYLQSHVGPDEALWVPAAASSNVTIPVSQPGVTVQRAGKPPEDAPTSVSVWVADITLNGGAAVGVFAADQYKGQPAIVANTVGGGRTSYIATTHPDDMMLGVVLGSALHGAGVEMGHCQIKHVEIVRRGNVTFAINHRAEPIEALVGEGLTAIVGAVKDGRVRLEPYGVAILETA